MLAGAALLMRADSKTLQDSATKLGSLFAAGLLGLYMLGFLTKRGDGRAVAFGIICTLVFTAYMTAVEMKLFTVEDVMRLGATKGMATWILQPIDTYYTRVIGDLLMFCASYALAAVLFPNKKDLTNLTVWTTPRGAYDEPEPAK
jgi:SSS family solute:Na+ symporter